LNNERDKITNCIKQVWFNNVAKAYGMDQSHNLTMQNMDKKFAAMFPVDQQRLHHDHFFTHVTRGAKTLFVAAAGDANNSPHFMRYSGLTGAREDILHLQKRTEAICNQTPPAKLAELEYKLKQDFERTAEFVISRGTAFLKPKTQEEIESLRLQKMKAMLDLQTRVTKKADGVYTLSKHTIRVQKDGSLEMDGKNYDSFAQINLESLGSDS
jgi:hypothetical protein